jgi:hypothetical protein
MWPRVAVDRRAEPALESLLLHGFFRTRLR